MDDEQALTEVDGWFHVLEREWELKPVLRVPCHSVRGKGSCRLVLYQTAVHLTPQGAQEMNNPPPNLAGGGGGVAY